MNPQDPLAELQPLREPLAIGWWPPAPGWWLLLALAAIALALLAWWLVRRYRANAYRRQALAQLAQLFADHQQHRDSAQLLGELNALLKSVALVAYPRRDVAALTGDQWLGFLNGELQGAGQFPAAFVSGAYHRNIPTIDAEQLQRTAATWIRRHRVAP